MALIRKKTGNFLEDFRLGQLFRHKGGRTVTEGITAHFTDFSFTANPLHRNLRYAQRYGYDALPIPPGLVMAVAFSQTVEDISENARANLEYIDMRFGASVYVGDTIETETTVLGVKSSSSKPELGVVHVQSIARKQTGQIVLAYQRKVQVFKHEMSAKLDEGEVPAAPVDVALELPAYDPNAGYAELAHLSNADTYFEDFTPGDTIEHSRGRVMTDEHIFLTGMLDNTSQVHCNQTMIDRDPSRYLGGKLVVYGGIPFTLCLGPVEPRHLGQQPRRHRLQDRPPQRADLLRRHRVRLDRDPRQARLPGPPRPRPARGHPARPQVRAQPAATRSGSRSSTSSASSR